jgi:hypothetical protein
MESAGRNPGNALLNAFCEFERSGELHRIFLRGRVNHYSEYAALRDPHAYLYWEVHYEVRIGGKSEKVTYGATFEPIGGKLLSFGKVIAGGRTQVRVVPGAPMFSFENSRRATVDDFVDLAVS